MKRKVLTLLPYACPLLLWLVLVAPSIPNAEWFYLDDANVLLGASDVFTGAWWLVPGGVRYFPTVWLYRGIVWQLAGPDPVGFFFFQSILFLLVGSLVFLLARLLAGSPVAASAAAAFFFTSSTLPEVAYTLGKAEPVLLFFLLQSFVFSLLYFRRPSGRYVYLLLFGASAAMAAGSKETGLGLLLVFATAFSVLLLRRRRAEPGETTSRGKVRLYLGVLAFLAFLGALPYFLFRTGRDGAYVTYDLTLGTIQSNLAFYLGNHPDIFLMAAVSTILVILFALQGSRSGVTSPALAGAGALLAFAWALLFGMLLWRMALGYYLFPAAAVFELLAGVFLVRYFRSRVFSAMAVCFLVMLLLAKAYALPFNLYTAITQKAASEVYGEVLREYMKRAGADSRLYFEHWSSAFEGIYQTNVFTQLISNRPNQIAVGFGDVIGGAAVQPGVMRLAPSRLAGQERTWPQWGDFVLVEGNQLPAYWTVRGLVSSGRTDAHPLVARYGYVLRPVFRTGRESVLPYLDTRLRPHFDKVLLSSTLYSIEPSPEGTRGPVFLPLTPWWIDGWVGSSFEVKTFFDPSFPDLEFEGEMPAFSNDVSLRLNMNGRTVGQWDAIPPGVFRKQITLGQNLAPGAGKYETLCFLCSFSFNPKRLGTGPDPREMSWRLLRLGFRRRL